MDENKRCRWCGAVYGERTQSKARIRELEDALREIKDTQGKVCKDYEICQHISCSSSYSSWAIADKALSEKSGTEDA